MKRLLNILMAGLVIAGASCSDDLTYEPGGVTPVTGLLAPADNYYVELLSASTATVEFSWEPALAEDGQLPHYEVVFMSQPDGDIVYRLDAGSSTTASFAHKDLNLAAKAAGIEAGESGDMYWAVVSSRGVTEAPVGATPRCISVKRLFGFDVIPSTLYLTGEATETGTDLASAMQFQMTGADGGEFTVIGYLEAGKTYEMCEDTSGSGRRFSIEGGELREFGADVKPATAAASVETSGIYRIYVDFNTRATIVEQVTKLAMYQRDNVGGAVELTYQGLGVWLLEKHTTEDGDNRYGFVATLSGDTTYQEKWSSVNYNNNDAPTSGSAPDWWKIYMNKDITSDGWWGYTFKWITDSWSATKVVTIEVHMDHTRDYYYHTVTYIE